MKERIKDGTFVKRLQYILLFATLISFVYFVVLMNIVEPNSKVMYLRWSKYVGNRTRKVVTTTTNSQLWREKIYWNLKVEKIVPEIGVELWKNSASRFVFTTESNETSELTEKAIAKKTDSNRISPPSYENKQVKGVETPTENIEHFIPTNLRKIDWHNYEQIENEKLRQGLGEQGQPAIPASGIQRTFQEGFDEELSDEISLNRSIPDLRDKKCFKKLYITSLPSVSVVIPFYDEHLSTLLRTIYSVINRSPPKLLKEVLVVDDGNNQWKEALKFYQYVAKHLPKVKIISLPQRSGLMVARMAGARNATGDVVVVLDSHTEANVNWLPPLLEPIALNYRTVVLPFIDAIEPSNFHYRGQHSCGRNVFDWELGYFRLPLPPRDQKKLPEPYETPVMTGGLFAISRAFFLELGGYDPGLRSWAGEQYELSFKIWQCGGNMLEAPCSRVGHLYRIHGYSGGDAARNFRRVAEVWMDEYAQYVYKRIPGLLTIDPGNLTEQRALRKRLNCKSFRWYMERVAFDIPDKFPMIEPAPFAQGQIRPVDQPELCADAGNVAEGDSILLKECGNEGPREQSFFFSWEKDLRVNGTKMCWTVPDPAVIENAVFLQPCTNTPPQRWKYNPDSKKITFGGYSMLCLTKHGNSLFLDHCQAKYPAQEWLLDHIDYERVAMWDYVTRPVTGPKRDWSD